MTRLARAALLAFFALSLAGSAFARGRVIINNVDGPNEGLNDATPATPVGGNAGTTVGQQRLNAMQYAADIWTNLLDIEVDVVVDAQFNPLQCDANSAVLGSTRPFTRRNFPNAPKADVWYPSALANTLAKQDLAPGSADMSMSYNANLGQSNCLSGSGFYYGFDANHGNQIDFVATVLHEIAHGLGFTSNFDSGSGGFGTTASGPTVYDLHIFDRQAGMFWTQMDNAQRLASSTNDQNIVFDGASTNAAVPLTLGPTPFLRIDAPSSVAKRYIINVAAFSGAITIPGIAGSLAAPVDAAETVPNSSGVTGTTTDGCSEYTNKADIAGKIALVDRGYCNFTVKAQLAQAAGALGLIVVDNRAASSPPGMGGTPDTAINIPVISVTQADGAALRAQIAAGENGAIFGDASLRAGADQAGHAKLYAPGTYAPGSSISHWDISATPNLLMEPNISDDLKHNVDLTIDELLDIGWSLAPQTGRRILRRH
jgi:PA domain